MTPSHTYRKYRLLIILLVCVIGVTTFVLAGGTRSGSTQVVIELTEAEVKALQNFKGSDWFPTFELNVETREENQYQLIVTYEQAEELLPGLLYGDEILALEREHYEQYGPVPPVDEALFKHWKTVGEKIQHTLVEKDIEVDPRSTIQYFRDIVRSARAEQYEFVIRGEVVDDSGRPLKGVRVEVMREIVGLNPFADYPPMQLFASKSVNRVFGFRVPDAYGVEAVFEKEGYYPASISTSRGQVSDVRHGEPIVQEFEVVLIEKGQPARGFIEILSRQAGLLLFNADGSGKAIRLDMPEPPSPMPEDRSALVNHYRPMVQANRQFNLRGDHFLQNVMNAMEDYPHGIVLSASTDEDDAYIQPKVISWEKMIRGHPRTYRTVVPARIELQMTNEDDGFVIVPFHPVDHLHTHNLMRRMREAPKNGYQNRLVIDADFWLSYIDVNGRGHVGFYFKLGGLYGKGRLYAPARLMNQDQFLIDPTEKMEADNVRAVIELYLQVDGTRNVVSN